MRPALLAMLVLSGCRYLTPAMPEVTPGDSRLLPNGNLSDPTRQAQVPGRRCVVACAPGFVCDDQTASCVPEKGAPLDAGPAWLP
jgi:hypothetical protein